jgi:hypothetical protein
MTDEMLSAVLETAGAKTSKDGESPLPEGRTMTLYAAHAGVPLTITKIESVRKANGLVKARNAKGETFVLAMDDLFAAAVEGAVGDEASGRKAGFLGRS